MSGIEDIKIDALKSNENYNNTLNRVKEKIKSKVLAMSTKEEQIQYVQQEKNRYKLLKETDNTYVTIAMITALCALISVILLNVLKSNIVFLVLWLVALVILLGAVISGLLLSTNGKKIKYTILIMAYEEIQNKIENGTEVDTSEVVITKRIDALKDAINVVEDQLRMIYALQKESNKKNKK